MSKVAILPHTEGVYQTNADIDFDVKPDDQHVEFHEEPRATSLESPLSPWKSIRKFWRTFLTGCLASVGALYIGYTFTALSNIIANKGFIHVFGTVHTAKGLSLDAHHVAIWGAVQIAAQILFQTLSPFVIDRFGRKVAMWGVLFWMIIAIILEIVAKNWKVFLAAKIFSGFASGWLGPSFMTYMSEIAMPEFRGVMLCVFAFAFKIGPFTNAIACQIVNKHSPTEYKRVFYSEFLFVGLLLGAVIYLPESPIWLITKGKEQQAKESLRKICGDVEGWDREAYYQSLVAEVAMSKQLTREQNKNDWKALFTKTNFRRCVASAIPFCGQQFSGIPYIFNYTTYFFQLAGLADPFTGNVIIQVITVATLFASFFLVDRVGRRPLLLYGMLGCTIFNLLIGGLGFLKTSPTVRGGALVAMCSCWVVSYALSVGPLGWLGLVEVSSIALRAKTAAFGVLMNSFVNLVMNYTVPLLLSDQGAGWGQKIGLYFGGLSALYLIPCFWLYPETKGRTYGEIDELYTRRVPPRKFHRTSTSARPTAGTTNEA